jgi:uncharacterized protein YvpB
MLLNYLGYNVSKTTLADKYLPKKSLSTCKDPNVAFIGNPRQINAYGCYAPVIVNCANSYLKSVGANRTVKNITGCSFDTLYRQVNMGRPVLVWGTMYWLNSYKSTSWGWLANEHCLVLVGYTSTTVTLNDPLKGRTTISRATFENRFKQLGKQAVVIY